MALEITDSSITSDVTPEIARFVATPHGGAWVLSWLPDIALTREQAVSGMVLDETLSDPHSTDSELALELAAIRADDLGIGLREIIIRLYTRIAERDRDACMDRPDRISVTTSPAA
jgi:hypothetical protein